MSPERAAEIIVKGVLGGRARVLVGLDAHALHHFARLTGSRYQDVVAAVAKRTKPPKRLTMAGRAWRSSVGDPVRIEMTKWGDRPHWHIPRALARQRRARRLGRHPRRHPDGPARAGRRVEEQPGRAGPAGRRRRLRARVGRHVPRAGVPAGPVGVRRHDHPAGLGRRTVLRAVDLDLDVVRGTDGPLVVDDEDEFAEHQVALGYPPEVVAPGRGQPRPRAGRDPRASTRRTTAATNAGRTPSRV